MIEEIAAEIRPDHSATPDFGDVLLVVSPGCCSSVAAWVWRRAMTTGYHAGIAISTASERRH